MPWSALTATEQGHWNTVGLKVAEAYQNAEARSLQGPDSWRDFSRLVYVQASPPWEDLPAAAREALAALEFTSETWGRQWALLERIFYNKVGVLTWDEVCNPYQPFIA